MPLFFLNREIKAKGRHGDTICALAGSVVPLQAVKLWAAAKVVYRELVKTLAAPDGGCGLGFRGSQFEKDYRIECSL